jgi:hypothetical protein
VVTATPGGRFVTKLRGAAQGVLPLVAELIVAELATAIDLSVPERVIIELGEDTPTDDRNDELLDLLARSAGRNIGFRYLDGAEDYVPGKSRAIDPEVAARILWLDGLVANPDRTDRNSNVLLWKGQPWLIDHGAALAFHYRLHSLTEQSPREPAELGGHVFAGATQRLAGADAVCAALLGRDVLANAAAVVPDDLLAVAFPDEEPRRMREAYVAYLWKRLKPPRPFVEPVSS